MSDFGLNTMNIDRKYFLGDFILNVIDEATPSIRSGAQMFQCACIQSISLFT